MAIKEIFVYNNGLGELLRDFVCDTEAELADIPGLDKGVISGSTVTCLENKKRYMLSVAGEWKEAPSLGGPSEEEMALKADLVGGKVPESQLPSYVDDVMEFPTLDDFPVEGEKDKIYVDVSTTNTYRWSGTTYIALMPAIVDGGTWK